MRRSTILTILISVMLFASAPRIQAQDAYDKFWRSYSEFGFRGGDSPETGLSNLFLPLHQSEVNMLFADLRGNWTDTESVHGNFGLGFRQMLINEFVFGVYGFYDIRHSEIGNNFHQGSLGVELLNPDWGLRWNGYFAGEGPQAVSGLNQAAVIGNNLFVRSAAERAYSGQDLEIEGRLLASQRPSDGSWQNWFAAYDFEIWGSIGVYHYENDANGFEDITGPRARLELRILDLPVIGPDSRLVFAGQIEDDDVRGDVSSASMLVRIPFGRGTSRDRHRLQGQNRRMVAPIVRNNEIMTNVAFGGFEAAVFAESGQAISEVVTIDGNTAAPESVFTAVGAEDRLILADGSNGAIAAGPIQMQNGQTLLGGGGQLLVRGLNSGTLATFTAPGTRPLFSSGANTTLTAANNSSIIGVDMSNSGVGQSGVFLNAVTDVVLEDLGLGLTGQGAFGIQAENDSDFSLIGSTVLMSGNTANGIRLRDTSTGSILDTSVTTSGDGAVGLLADGISFTNLQQSRVFTSGGGQSFGIQVADGAQLVASSNTITTTGPATDAIVASPTGAGNAMAVQINNNLINATGNGIVLGGTGFNAGTLDASLTNNQISVPTGSNEIDAETNGTAVLNLSAQGNAVDPIVGTIRLDANGGTINVTQADAEFAALNGLPASNVLVPNGTIQFEQPAPVAPTPAP